MKKLRFKGLNGTFAWFLFFFDLQIALFLTLCQFWQFYNLNVIFDKNKDQSVEKKVPLHNSNEKKKKQERNKVLCSKCKKHKTSRIFFKL